jgi:hypothetical protein
MNIQASSPVGWDMHPVCHIYSILCLLRLQLEDPSSFTQAAPKRRTGDDVTCEILELRPHIYLLHTLRAYRVLPSVYQFTATCGESWQHSLKKNNNQFAVSVTAEQNIGP